VSVVQAVASGGLVATGVTKGNSMPVASGGGVLIGALSNLAGKGDECRWAFSLYPGFLRLIFSTAPY
jgi:hypothetical protein